MNNSQKKTSKAIALFLSLGIMSSLTGCEIGNTNDGDDGDDGDTPTEQPNNTPDDDDGGEGGES